MGVGRNWNYIYISRRGGGWKPSASSLPSWERIVSIPTYLGGGGGVCEPREDSQEPEEMWQEVAEIQIIG